MTGGRFPDAAMPAGIRCNARRLAWGDTCSHVLAVAAVEEAGLLLAMRRIVGGVEIQQNLTLLAYVVAAEANELFPENVAQAHQITGGRESTTGGLRTESLGSRIRQPVVGTDAAANAVECAIA
jgi:hypothetical protein